MVAPFDIVYDVQTFNVRWKCHWQPASSPYSYFLYIPLLPCGYADKALMNADRLPSTWCVCACVRVCLFSIVIVCVCLSIIRRVRPRVNVTWLHFVISVATPRRRWSIITPLSCVFQSRKQWLFARSKHGILPKPYINLRRKKTNVCSQTFVSYVPLYLYVCWCLVCVCQT